MKNVLKLLIATAAMTVMAVSAFAQGAGPAGGAKGGQRAGGPGGPGGPGGMRRGGILNFDQPILDKLKLTADQQKKVKALKAETQKKGEELRKSMAAANKGEAPKPGERPKMSPEMREKFKAITEGYQAGLKKILTPTQFADYEKGIKEMRAKMRGGAGGPGAGAAGKGKGNKKGGTPPPQA